MHITQKKSPFLNVYALEITIKRALVFPINRDDMKLCGLRFFLEGLYESQNVFSYFFCLHLKSIREHLVSDYWDWMIMPWAMVQGTFRGSGLGGMFNELIYSLGLQHDPKNCILVCNWVASKFFIPYLWKFLLSICNCSYYLGFFFFFFGVLWIWSYQNMYHNQYVKNKFNRIVRI